MKSSSDVVILDDSSVIRESCDTLNLINSNASTSAKNIDVTSNSSSTQSSHKKTIHNGDEFAASTEATANSLLNLIVRLARASVNLNILSSDSNEKESELKKSESSASEQEALNFMNGIMDELTHLKNYSVPVDPTLTIAVCADNDAYVPIKNRSHIAEVWPGAEVRYVPGGHVRAYVQCQKEFRTAIIDAFQRYREKYIDSELNSEAPGNTRR